MRRTMIAAALFAALALAAAAQTATVEEFTGKVEYRLGTGEWRAVTRGLAIPVDATISTGFGATATLRLGNSVIRVAQLTRLTIEELADTGTTVTTGVFVPVGRVQAAVSPTAERSTDFRVRTPQSTAAVRGTGFDTNGWQITVTEGIVEFASLLGQTREVGATQISVITDGGPTSPLDEANRQASIGDVDAFAGGPRSSGYITVRWRQ